MQRGSIGAIVLAGLGGALLGGILVRAVPQARANGFPPVLAGGVAISTSAPLFATTTEYGNTLHVWDFNDPGAPRVRIYTVAYDNNHMQIASWKEMKFTAPAAEPK